MSKPWFRAKSYGLGYSPEGWRGWAALAAFLVLALANIKFTRALVADRREGDALSTGVMALLIAGLIAVVVLKSDGSPLRWRWGGRRS
jgi:hypothetical protein